LEKRTINRTVVISAVNLNEGGPLSIMRDAINAFVTHFAPKYKLVLLIHNKNLLENIEMNGNVKIYEYTYPKKAWILRIWFEYVHAYFISQKIKPFLWFSLHDVTPNVYAVHKAVYCQNPSPFYKISNWERKLDKSFYLFNKFYKYLYRINIHKNDFVIVQQNWIREKFKKIYKLPHEKIIVAYPSLNTIDAVKKEEKSNQETVFFYPAFPRVFKNHLVLLKAANILFQHHVKNFKIIITIDGTENRYAKLLFDKFSYLPCIEFAGLISPEKMKKFYQQADCLVFPSKLETWGLPISEAKQINLPVLAADLEYAKETTGNYNKVLFFNSDNADELANLLKNIITKTIAYGCNNTSDPPDLFCRDWQELINILIDYN
jgi:glycosyltransferase involved in cell wall biosynthesis